MVLTVQGYGKVVALIHDPMDPEFVGHVRLVVFFMCFARYHFHRLLSALFGEVISNLSQVSFQYLHQAVGVAVVVDGTALARRPHKDKL